MANVTYQTPLYKFFNYIKVTTQNQDGSEYYTNNVDMNRVVECEYYGALNKTGIKIHQVLWNQTSPEHTYIKNVEWSLKSSEETSVLYLYNGISRVSSYNTEIQTLDLSTLPDFFKNRIIGTSIFASHQLVSEVTTFENSGTINPSGNAGTVEIKLCLDQFTVKSNYNADGSYLTPATITPLSYEFVGYTQTGTFTAEQINNDNFNFINWTSSDNITFTQDAQNQYRVYVKSSGGDGTITANFQRKYSVFLTATDGGTTNPEKNHYYYVTPGETFTATATPYEGYAFVKWKVKNGEETYEEFNTSCTITPDPDINSNNSLEAYFGRILTVTTSSNNTAYGTATPATQNVTEGNVCTVKASPKAGYKFVNWTKDGAEQSTNATYTFTPTESVALVANFRNAYYTVTTTSNNATFGTAEPATQNINEGNQCTVNATPKGGYQFVNWTKGGVEQSKNALYQFTPTADTALTANFEKVPENYTVTTKPNNAQYGTTTPATKTVQEGTSVQIKATPNKGYAFVEWQNGGVKFASTATKTFTPTEDTNLVAVFKTKKPMGNTCRMRCKIGVFGRNKCAKTTTLRKRCIHYDPN